MGAAMISRTKDFRTFEVENTFYEYKWTRCVELPAFCGFGPYPRDPNALVLEDDLTVFYGMQKTCSFSGREFYAIGRVNENHSFVPLENRARTRTTCSMGRDTLRCTLRSLHNRTLWISQH